MQRQLDNTSITRQLDNKTTATHDTKTFYDNEFENDQSELDFGTIPGDLIEEVKTDIPQEVETEIPQEVKTEILPDVDYYYLMGERTLVNVEISNNSITDPEIGKYIKYLYDDNATNSLQTKIKNDKVELHPEFAAKITPNPLRRNKLFIQGYKLNLQTFKYTDVEIYCINDKTNIEFLNNITEEKYFQTKYFEYFNYYDDSKKKIAFSSNAKLFDVSFETMFDVTKPNDSKNFEFYIILKKVKNTDGTDNFVIIYDNTEPLSGLNIEQEIYDKNINFKKNVDMTTITDYLHNPTYTKKNLTRALNMIRSNQKGGGKARFTKKKKSHKK